MLRQLCCMAVCLLLLAHAGCRKTNNKACDTQLMGRACGTAATGANYGIINPDKATLAASNIALSAESTISLATIDRRDGSYYVFCHYTQPSQVYLYRVSPSGDASRYLSATTIPGGAQYTGVLYNSVNKRLYGFKLLPDIMLSELQLQDATFTEVILNQKNATYTTGSLYPPDAAVDEVTGDIYWSYRARANPATGATIKYTPGHDTQTVVQYAADVFGLTFSRSDDCFYGIACDSVTNGTGYRFVKMSRDGMLTDIVSLPFAVNREFHSAALDDCRKVYILSTTAGNKWDKQLLFQINTDGTNMRAASSPYLYQSIAVRY